MVSREEVLAEIGTAMQVYAGFEFHLFNLVDTLLQTKREHAAAVFYSVKNSRDRNAMLKSLLRIRCGDSKTDFRRSLLKWINETDKMRNRLAHGLLIPDVETDPPDYVIGKPVEYWILDWPAGNAITRQNIAAYIEQTSELMEILRRFTGVLGTNNMPADLRAEWDSACEAAFDLPLPADHPLRSLGTN